MIPLVIFEAEICASPSEFVLERTILPEEIVAFSIAFPELFSTLIFMVWAEIIEVIKKNVRETSDLKVILKG